MSRLAGCAALVGGAAVWLAAGVAHAELYYVVVGGLGGEAKYQEAFDRQTASLVEAAKRTAGEARVTVLTGPDATRAALEHGIAELAGRIQPTDTLAVFLVGHGSFDGEAYKLNLPGPDLTGDELAALLSSVPARSQLIMNATSASGAVLEKWAADGRTVITATRSGFERNATRFAEHWAAALSSEEADVNKNGVITAQEAFDFAARAVADSFAAEGLLATEHPQLSGDAAGRFSVARLQAFSDAGSPEEAALRARLEALEGEIEALRGRREQMPAEVYLDELQALLVELATAQQELDAAAGGAGP